MPSIQYQQSLKVFNTFGIDAYASLFAYVDTIQALQTLLTTDHAQNKKKLILGGGSNILLTQHFDGLVIKNEIKGIQLINETSEDIFLTIGAGENWHQLVLYCIQKGWGGIENLSLIPGTVGAAPMQNIGAYGVEICDCFYALDALNIESGKIETFSRSDCQFSYRNSVFKNELKNKMIICSVSLLLKKKPKLSIDYGAIKDILKTKGITEPSIKAISDAVIDIRRQKLPDPKKIHNAGSFFKNPIISADLFKTIHASYPEIPHYENNNQFKIPAAWLIEQCGWKGKRIDNIGVHEKQALVLINHNTYSDPQVGQAIHELATSIQTSVLKKFTIPLHTEVNIIN